MAFPRGLNRFFGFTSRQQRCEADLQPSIKPEAVIFGQRSPPFVYRFSPFISHLSPSIEGHYPLAVAAPKGDAGYIHGWPQNKKSMSRNREPVSPLILHCHIPKTAGTTISAGFRKSFDFLHIHHYHPDPFYILDKATLETLLEIYPNLRSISSHHLRSFPLSVRGRPTFLVTFLRKPEDAIISHLRYIQRNFWSLPELTRRIWPANAPFLSLREFAREYLDQESSTEDLCQQTRFICNPDAGALFGLSDGNPKGLNSYEIAHQILTGFHFVGVVEEMKKSLEVLADRLLHCGIPVYFDHNLKLNTSKETSAPAWLTPEDEVGRRVLAASKNDDLLYDFFRNQLIHAHRELRKRRWLGFKPAARDAKEAFSQSGSDGTRSLLNSARLFLSRKDYRIDRPIIPSISSDVLELRAAQTVAERLQINGAVQESKKRSSFSQ
jgi:hypothetical protein